MTKNRKGNKKRKAFNSELSESKIMLKRQKLSDLPEADRQRLETLFNKKCSYKKPDSFVDCSKWIEEFVPSLQDVEAAPIWWEDQALMSLKKGMNDLKDQLSSKDIESWHNHTTECNPAGKIIPYLKSLDIELCTQAWVKFYEILTSFTIVPDKSFLSIHLCEAPGAFITSLNHYLQRNGFPHAWDWVATTLNPYHEANSLSEMIADDRLIRSTHSKWYFGSDGSGDIKAGGHIEGLVKKVRRMEEEMGAKVLLVTADGSKDCQENPAEQESLLSQLHHCEMLAGCLMLAPGGSLVVKIFTMFEAATISLLCLLNVLFEQVNVFKPATSKSGNSEVYLVSTNYRANMKEETLWRMLKAARDSSVTCFLPQDRIPRELLEDHRTFCQRFAQWQADIIKLNMETYQKISPQILDGLLRQQHMAVELYLEVTNMKTHQIQRLVPYGREKSSFYIEKLYNDPERFVNSARHSSPHAGSGCWQHKNLKGTFHLRQNISALSFQERIRLMDIRQVVHPNTGLTLRCPVTEEEVEEWKEALHTAKVPRAVLNSRLCDGAVMDDYNFLLEHSQYLDNRKTKKTQHITAWADLLHRVVQSLSVAQRTQTNLQQQQPHHYQQQEQPLYLSPRGKDNFNNHYSQQQYNNNRHSFQSSSFPHNHRYQNQEQQHQQHYHHNNEDNGTPPPHYQNHNKHHHHHHHHYQQHQQQKYKQSYSPRKDNYNFNHNHYLHNQQQQEEKRGGHHQREDHHHQHQQQQQQQLEKLHLQDVDQQPTTPQTSKPTLSPPINIPSNSNNRNKLQPTSPNGKPYTPPSPSPSQSPFKPHSQSPTPRFLGSPGKPSSFHGRYNHSAPLRSNPESFNSTTTTSSSQMKKLVWIKNGSNGGNNALLQKLFLENLKTGKNTGLKIEFQDLLVQDENKDKNDGGDSSSSLADGEENDSDNSGNGVVYILNATRLFSGLDDSCKNEEGEGEGGGAEPCGADGTMTSSSSSSSSCEELQTRQFCLDQVALVLKKLPSGANLVVLATSFVTRFQAGCLHILARCFSSVQVTSDPNLWLHQLVVCRVFQGATPSLPSFLASVQGRMKQEGEEEEGGGTTGIVETVKFIHIINDRKFVQLVSSHNNYLLAGFINLMLEYYKRGDGGGKGVVTTTTDNGGKEEGGSNPIPEIGGKNNTVEDGGKECGSNPTTPIDGNDNKEIEDGQTDCSWHSTPDPKGAPAS